MYNIGILDVMFSFLSDASHSLRKYNSTLIQHQRILLADWSFQKKAVMRVLVRFGTTLPLPILKSSIVLLLRKNKK